MEREKILCAAIWVDDNIEYPHQPRNITTGMVFSGWRHSCCFPQIHLAFPPGSASVEQIAGKNQGFLTSWGRFVDRNEAGRIAFIADQVSQPDMFLCSEDLY